MAEKLKEKIKEILESQQEFDKDGCHIPTIEIPKVIDQIIQAVEEDTLKIKKEIIQEIIDLIDRNDNQKMSIKEFGDLLKMLFLDAKTPKEK